MNKKISMREDSKVFDLTAFKVLLSVLAISLASMMANAFPLTTFTVGPTKPLASKAKNELLSCTAPSATNFCANDTQKSSCEIQRANFLQSLNPKPFIKASTKPSCSMIPSDWLVES